MSANQFYQKEQYCPVCLSFFKRDAVRYSSAYVQTMESDFHVIYSNTSPLHYAVAVCPVCNFAAPNSVFKSSLPQNIIDSLARALLVMYPDKINLCGERTPGEALKSWQMAIQSGQLRKATSGEMGGIFLGAAWMSRELHKSDLESTYLRQSLAAYIDAHDNEPMPIGKMDEVTVMFLIGELNRRIGNFREAIGWFDRLLNDRKVKKNPRLEKMTREQWQQASSEYKSTKKEVPEESEEIEDFGFLNATLESPVPSGVSDVPRPRPTSSAKQRRTMQVPANLYNDQIEWLNKMVNRGYDMTKQLVSKEQVLRALLDASIDILKHKEITEPFATEEQLVEVFKKLLKE